MSRPSFVALPKPIVTCIFGQRTVEGAIANIRNGEFDGAPAFAIHLEFLGAAQCTEENFKRITASTRRPIMFLHYRKNALAPVSLTDEERMAVLKLGVECGAAAIDITADTFDPQPLEFSTDANAVAKQRAYIDEIHALGAEVVMSSHIQEARTREQVVEQMLQMEQRGADFVKIVTLADTEAEFVEAMDTTLALRHALSVPFIHLVGGKFGIPHRYMSPSLGNALTFCVHDYNADYTTQQPPIRNMLGVINNMAWHIE